MADLSKINVAGVEYNVKDAEARGNLPDKADRVTGGTDGNFAGLNATGNLTDSGKKAADFAAANHNHNLADLAEKSYDSLDDKPTIPTVPAISTSVSADAASDTKTASPKAVKTYADGLSDVLWSRADRVYAGVDLTVKFATEIAGYADVWAWLHARVLAVNWTGIHIGDYIPITMAGETVLMQVAGIDSYYNTAGNAFAHHIDFISKDCRSATLKWNLTDVNQGFIGAVHPISSNAGLTVVQSDKGELFSTAVSNTDGTYIFTYSGTSWQRNAADVNLATTYGITVTGTPAAGDTITCYYVYANGSPWKTSNAYDVLNLGSAAAGASWYSQLPEALKAYIIQKRFYAPTRYNVSSNLSSDNSGAWADIGKLWLPLEAEVYSAPVWGGTGIGNGFSAQYPIFDGGLTKRIRGAGNGGDRTSWWLASAYAGSLTSVCFVGYPGNATYNAASYSYRAPVCFRFQ